MDATFYCFGPFRLYPSEQRLLHGLESIPLAPKTFEVLRALVAGDGALLTREALMQAVWPRGYVEEINLTVNISLLRKALGTLEDGSSYIVTVPKCGYRFNAPVTQGSAAPIVPTAPSVPSHAAAADVAPPEPDRAAPAATLSGSTLTLATTRPRRTANRLRWAPPMLLALAALGGAIWLVHARSGRSVAPSTAITSLAVLPFELISDRADDSDLGLGMTDALITRLSGQTLKVRSTAAVRRYAGSTDPAAAGAELQVDAVLDGTIQRNAGQTRVSVRLLRVDSGAIVWTDTFDAPPEAAFAIEDSISQRLWAALAPELHADGKASRTTSNSAARDLYTRALARLGRDDVAAARSSLALFEQAIRSDPTYAPAYAGLADAYLVAGMRGNAFPDPGLAPQAARQAAEKALALNQASPEAHTLLAYLLLTQDWDWQGAEQEFKRALALDPAYVNAHLCYAHELVAQGRLDEAYAESRAALALAPGDIRSNDELAWQHLYARDYAAAIAQAGKATAIDPEQARAYQVRGLALLYTGAYASACSEFRANLVRSPGSPAALAHLARCHAATHRPAEARAILATLERAGQHGAPPVEIAAVHAALGDSPAALHWLEQAGSERASALIYLNVDPAFDTLRGQPRFQALVARVNPRPPSRRLGGHGAHPCARG